MFFPEVHFIDTVTATMLVHCDLRAALPLGKHQVTKGN
jgi:hypothetical protein